MRKRKTKPFKAEEELQQAFINNVAKASYYEMRFLKSYIKMLLLNALSLYVDTKSPDNILFIKSVLSLYYVNKSNQIKRNINDDTEELMQMIVDSLIELSESEDANELSLKVKDMRPEARRIHAEQVYRENLDIMKRIHAYKA